MDHYNLPQPISSFSFSHSLTLSLSRFYCKFSPLAATHFLVNQLQEFGVRSGSRLSPDKSEYSHHLFAGYMNGNFKMFHVINHFWEFKDLQ